MPETSKVFEMHTTESGETITYTSLDGQHTLSLEVASAYTSEERAQLVESTHKALAAVNSFANGNAILLFSGLSIQIGEGLAKGGGEAFPSENRIALNGKKMLLSLAQMRVISDSYSDDELNGSTIDEDAPGGALEYSLVHEMGHILDGRTESGQKRHRVAAGESPTRYGREPDKWSEDKEHEAFPEGFAHMVYGMPVSDAMADAVLYTIKSKLSESSTEP